ncbi:MAG: metallophosphoesterase [Bacillota bacterium]
MIIGVVSDSHGNTRALEEAVNFLKDCDALIHAGDFYKDGLYLAQRCQLPCYAVGGNCDIGPKGPRELTVEIEGKRFFITHGHMHLVKRTLDDLIKVATDRDVDCVVFGHTHVPYAAWLGPRLFFNPGSVSIGRSSSGNTLGYIEVSKGELQPQIIRLT